MQRRKTLMNALQNSEIGIDKEELKKVLNTLGIDERVRGEALTLEDFINITNLL